MKGMTNALPVLIDASTLATKSDISDMETKTNANATFATKTALTTLQNATKVAVSEFAITESADKVTITTTAIDGATSKSEDIPAVTDTMAGIITAEWFKKLKELYDSRLTGFILKVKLDLYALGTLTMTINNQTLTVDLTKTNDIVFINLPVNQSLEMTIETTLNIEVPIVKSYSSNLQVTNVTQSTHTGSFTLLNTSKNMAEVHIQVSF